MRFVSFVALVALVALVSVVSLCELVHSNRQSPWLSRIDVSRQWKKKTVSSKQNSKKHMVNSTSRCS
jgi:hypothetical protein